MRTSGRLTSRAVSVLIGGIIATGIGYALAATDWGGGGGTLGWFLMIAGLALLAAVALIWFWQISGGIDWAKLRNRKGPRDPANEPRPDPDTEAHIQV